MHQKINAPSHNTDTSSCFEFWPALIISDPPQKKKPSHDLRDTCACDLRNKAANQNANIRTSEGQRNQTVTEMKVILLWTEPILKLQQRQVVPVMGSCHCHLGPIVSFQLFFISSVWQGKATDHTQQWCSRDCWEALVLPGSDQQIKIHSVVLQRLKKKKITKIKPA